MCQYSDKRCRRYRDGQARLALKGFMVFWRIQTHDLDWKSSVKITSKLGNQLFGTWVVVSVTVQLVGSLKTFFFSTISAIVEGLQVEFLNFIITLLYNNDNL